VGLAHIADHQDAEVERERGFDRSATNPTTPFSGPVTATWGAEAEPEMKCTRPAVAIRVDGSSPQRSAARSATSS
jgi:hypothetical protein